jgi:hypothetical protein
MSDNRQCRVQGCAKTHPRHMYCCRSHWYALPKHYRDAIWRTYRSPGVFSKEYMQAAENAEAYLEDRNAEPVADPFV